MARIKKSSLERAKNDANSFGILSDRFHNNREEKNEDVSHRNIKETMIGRKFQYVTRAGKRKNYVIRSYDANTGTHSVRRITESDDDRDFGHKTRDITMEDLPNIRWMDTIAFLPAGDSQETTLYSSRYIGVKYRKPTNKTAAATYNNYSNSQCRWNWKAYAPLNNDGTGKMKYVGSFGSEKDAALAHDCFARMIGRSTLNFPDELIYKEEMEQRKRKRSQRRRSFTMSPSGQSLCASLSSGNSSDDSILAPQRSMKPSQEIVNNHAKENVDIGNRGDNNMLKSHSPLPPSDLDEIACLQEETPYAASKAQHEDSQLVNAESMESVPPPKRRKLSQFIGLITV